EHTLVGVVWIPFTISLAAAIENKTVGLSITEFLPDTRRDRRKWIARHVFMKYLLDRAPTAVSLIAIVKPRIVVIPLMDDRHFPQDRINKVSLKGRIRIVEVLEHLSFWRKLFRVSVIKVPANKS